MDRQDFKLPHITMCIEALNFLSRYLLIRQDILDSPLKESKFRFDDSWCAHWVWPRVRQRLWQRIYGLFGLELVIVSNEALRHCDANPVHFLWLAHLLMSAQCSSPSRCGWCCIFLHFLQKGKPMQPQYHLFNAVRCCVLHALLTTLVNCQIQCSTQPTQF